MDQIHRYPRDLLRRLAASVGHSDEPSDVATAEEEDSGEIELSLGLSLGGCFGVDPKAKGIVRASSIASFSSLSREPEQSTAVAAAHALTRTCSLPVETDEEQRKRKEMQSLRRLEAKRKRSEKRGIRSGSSSIRDRAEESEGTRKGEVEVRGGGGTQCTGRNGMASSLQHNPQARPMMQGSSIGSVGSSSTGGSASDFDCRPMQGLDISCSGSNAQITAGNPGGCAREEAVQAEPDDTSKRNLMGGSRMQEMARTMMEQMPCVSTRGDGPNGRKVEGFLYKYGKGEEVRIVCVCHGCFLSPAEFVKHAGGGDVAHPLRHIVVNPSMSSLT